MNRVVRKFAVILAMAAGVVCLSGCASLLEEDPNKQQLPWAGPADWENTVPGMPNAPQ